MGINKKLKGIAAINKKLRAAVLLQIPTIKKISPASAKAGVVASCAHPEDELRQETLAGGRKERRAADAFQKENLYLREVEVALIKKVATLVDVVAKLTSQIRAEDDVFRRRYLASRRQVNRLQQKLRELTTDIEVEDGDESDDGFDRDYAEGASTLAVLATEANEILVRELAMETREGMETGGGGYKFGRAAPT
jgi:phage shock protein A